MEQERLAGGEQEMAMRNAGGEEERNAGPLRSARANVQVSNTLLCGANMLILTYVSTRPPCTHTSVKQPFLARVPLLCIFT